MGNPLSTSHIALGIDDDVLISENQALQQKG